MKANLNTWVTTVLLIGAGMVVYFVLADYFKKPEPTRVLTQPLQHKPSGFLEGNEHASVTIYKFFDYSCRYCKQMADELSILLKEDGQDYKIIHVPIPISDEFSVSYKAAAKSICFYSLTKELSTHHSLLSHHDNLQHALNTEWSTISTQNNKRYKNKIQACLDNQLYKVMIHRNREIAQELGIRSVPSLLVNNNIYVGAFSGHHLRSLIKFHLANNSSTKTKTHF